MIRNIQVFLVVFLISNIARAEDFKNKSSAITYEAVYDRADSEIERAEEISKKLKTTVLDNHSYLLKQWEQSLLEVKGFRGAKATASDQAKIQFYSSQVSNLQVMNAAVQSAISDTDRLLAIECCHKIKEQKICDSASEPVKANIKKCKESHKK